MSVFAPARDLVKEALHSSLRVKPVLEENPIPSKKPKQSGGSDTVETVRLLRGQSMPRYTQALSITVTEEACEDARDDLSLEGDAKREALSVLPGTYWLISADCNGKRVWRQEPTESCNNKELFLFFADFGNDVGWYASDTLFTNTVEMKLAKIFAYFKMVDDMPAHAHVPYWRKKAHDGVQVTGYCAQVTFELSIAYDRIAALEEHIAELQACQAKLGEIEAKREANKGQHGGWMPKCASLLAVFYKNDWGELKSLCNKFYGSSHVLKQLVDKQCK